MRRLLLATLALSACVPSRSALFTPVADSVHQRTGLRPDWRDGWERSPAVAARVKTILGKPLTADDAALLAVLGSPALQASYAELGLVGGKVGRARTPRNPEVEAEILYPVGDGATRVELAAVQDVSQLLSLLPRLRAADAELEAARHDAVAATIDLTTRARIAFYRAAAAEETLSRRRAVAEAATASAELARSLFAAGNITKLMLAREELFEEEALAEVSEAEAMLGTSREQLDAVLGLFGEETGWTLAKDALAELPASPPEVSDLEETAIRASLGLEAGRWRIEAAGQEIGVARLESFVPDLGVGVAARDEGDGWGVGPRVTLSIPIWDWGQGERREAWARLRREQQQYTADAVEIRAAARALGQSLRSAHARATRLRQRILPLRDQLMKEGVLQYNAMNLDAFELLVMRREQISAEIHEIRARADYWIALAQVDQLRAGGLPRQWAEEVLP